MTLNEIITILRRIWRIYIRPPKETKIFLDIGGMPVLSKKISDNKTAEEPKQVAVDLVNKLAYVTCMKGHSLQEFSYKSGLLVFTKEWLFPDQCVEIEFIEGLCYLTTTNFYRGDTQKSHLHVFDPVKGSKISSIDTQGEWSKVMCIDKKNKLVYVSNWHSNDISIVDISNILVPVVIQKVPCGKAPRGLVLRPDGVVIATSFYDRKIFAVGKVDGIFKIISESKPFDPKKYGGNMRDILITKDGKTLWVSNLGRNIVHWYDAYTLEIKGSIAIPREPNSMRFMDEKENIIGVSCRKDGVICFIDTITKKPVGISSKTERLPTGLAATKNGFIVTNFDDNSMELHEVKYR